MRFSQGIDSARRKGYAGSMTIEALTVSRIEIEDATIPVDSIILVDVQSLIAYHSGKHFDVSRDEFLLIN